MTPFLIIINAFTTDGDFSPTIKGRTHMKGLVHLQTCRYQDGLVPTTASWLKKDLSGHRLLMLYGEVLAIHPDEQGKPMSQPAEVGWSRIEAP